MKSFTFTLQIDCPYCGHMIALNGPATATTCNTCQKEVKLTPSSWSEQVRYASEGSRVFNNPYTCAPAGSSGKWPACPECEEIFSYDQSWLDHDFSFDCPQCGHEMHTYPAPDWLRAELTGVRQIIGGERPASDGRTQPISPDEGSTKPVMLSCPNCNAALKVTGASERTVSCDHCSVDVYLPDGLWLKLHPVQTVRPWTLVSEGKLETAEERREREERQRELETIMEGYQEELDAPLQWEEDGTNAADHSQQIPFWVMGIMGATMFLPTILGAIFIIVVAGGVTTCAAFWGFD